MNAVAKLETNVVPVSDSGALMEIISRAASDPGTDVGKLEKLMDLYERVKGNQAKQEFDQAMALAQEEMGPVRTDASNTQTKSKYATYAALDRALRPIYSKHGFAISYGTADGAEAGHVRVVADVMHRSGHSKTFHIDMPSDGKGAKGGDVMTKTHATGSAFSYGQRYLVKGIFNIVVSDDDDGNSAGGSGPISADQAATIRGLIERFKVNIESFCNTYKIEAIPDLPAAKYREAVERLNMKGVAK